MAFRLIYIIALISCAFLIKFNFILQSYMEENIFRFSSSFRTKTFGELPLIRNNQVNDDTSTEVPTRRKKLRRYKVVSNHTNVKKRNFINNEHISNNLVTTKVSFTVENKPLLKQSWISTKTLGVLNASAGPTSPLLERKISLNDIRIEKSAFLSSDPTLLTRPRKINNGNLVATKSAFISLHPTSLKIQRKIISRDVRTAKSVLPSSDSTLASLPRKISLDKARATKSTLISLHPTSLLFQRKFTSRNVRTTKSVLPSSEPTLATLPRKISLDNSRATKSALISIHKTSPMIQRMIVMKSRDVRNVKPAISLGSPKFTVTTSNHKQNMQQHNSNAPSVFKVVTFKNALHRRSKKIVTTIKSNTEIVKNPNHKKFVMEKSKLENDATVYRSLRLENYSKKNFNSIDNNTHVKNLFKKTKFDSAHRNMFTLPTKADKTLVTQKPNEINLPLSEENIKRYLINCLDEKIRRSFENIDYRISNFNETLQYVRAHCHGIANSDCHQTTAFLGSLPVRREIIDLDTLYSSELKFVNPGGWWSPENCVAKTQTAIIIPFRDRHQHLPVLLRQLHPILKRQQLHYRIFVIEQDGNDEFNRGKLMNVGYVEALKRFPYSCFVFHDVDLVPEDDRINYGCKHSPMHLSVAVDKFEYKLLYETLFGGIEMFSTSHYKTVNGFSNIFWSWGGEDDNLYKRVFKNRMSVYRQSPVIARYTMLVHESRGEYQSNKEKQNTQLLMDKALFYANKDGLNSLDYKLKSITEKKLYSLIKVDLLKYKDADFVKNL